MKVEPFGGLVRLTPLKNVPGQSEAFRFIDLEVEEAMALVTKDGLASPDLIHAIERAKANGRELRLLRILELEKELGLLKEIDK